jgi:hypothetical protein
VSHWLDTVPAVNDENPKRWTDGFRSPPSDINVPRPYLTADSVPRHDAPWRPDLARFALSFDGYTAIGSDLGRLANEVSETWALRGRLPDDLVLLRSCLFFEQRRQRHLDQPPGAFPPEGEWLDYVRALVEAIRVFAERGSTKDAAIDGSTG